MKKIYVVETNEAIPQKKEFLKKIVSKKNFRILPNFFWGYLREWPQPYFTWTCLRIFFTTYIFFEFFEGWEQWTRIKKKLSLQRRKTHERRSKTGNKWKSHNEMAYKRKIQAKINDDLRVEWRMNESDWKETNEERKIINKIII